MKEHPLLFTAEMVKAILDGRKTQTRRVPIERYRNWKVGDVIWVRETWQKIGDYPVCYRAGQSGCGACTNHTWRSPIHMFRKYARIFLEITGLRVERVQEISEEDSKAEGCAGWFIGGHPDFIGEPDGCMPSWEFEELWNSINAKRGYGWNKNLEVKVIEFKRL